MSKTGCQKSGDFCLKQGQGLRGWAAPPHPKIDQVPPPPLPGSKITWIIVHQGTVSLKSKLTVPQALILETRDLILDPRKFFIESRVSRIESRGSSIELREIMSLSLD